VRKEIESQIKKINKVLALFNLSRASNFPKWDGNDLVWEKYKNLSFSLKNEKYQILYKECLKEGDYSFVLIDGALVQMKYRFHKDVVIEHVLSFYPSPYIERFQDSPEDYMETHFSSDTFFSEINDELIVCSPVRFDFNNDDKYFVEISHPKSHLTIGNYKDCRIPVKSPISPNKFMEFILRNFYYEKYIENFTDNFFKCELKFKDTIVKSEKEHLHLNWS
jgi:hypothetical protein